MRAFKGAAEGCTSGLQTVERRVISHFISRTTGSTQQLMPRQSSFCSEHSSCYCTDAAPSTPADVHYLSVAGRRDVEDTYLPAFRQCVSEAKALSVMCRHVAFWGRSRTGCRSCTECQGG